MAKNPKPILRAAKGMEPERLKLDMQKERDLEQTKLSESKKEESQKNEDFNWSGFLIPNVEKIIMFLVVMAMTTIVYVVFVNVREVSLESVSSIIIFDLKTVLFVAACYSWACYAVERKLGWVKGLLLVLVPELLVIAYILVKVPKFKPPGT
ncbi:MAG: hypothetical protein V1909_04295 [Candidatus Micrarchaeota archaeon]